MCSTSTANPSSSSEAAASIKRTIFRAGQKTIHCTFPRCGSARTRQRRAVQRDCLLTAKRTLALSTERDHPAVPRCTHENYYYAYAIHDKIGTMSNGEHHTHVHLMFSTREIDDCERKQERQPDVFFRGSIQITPKKVAAASLASGTGRIAPRTFLSSVKILHESRMRYWRNTASPSAWITAV